MCGSRQTAAHSNEIGVLLMGLDFRVRLHVKSAKLLPEEIASIVHLAASRSIARGMGSTLGRPPLSHWILEEQAEASGSSESLSDRVARLIQPVSCERLVELRAVDPGVRVDLVVDVSRSALEGENFAFLGTEVLETLAAMRAALYLYSLPRAAEPA